MHLHQAQDITCTIEPFKTLLGKDSFTKFRDELLQGTTDLDDLGLTSLQKFCFKEIKKNQDHYNHHYHSPSLSKI